LLKYSHIQKLENGKKDEIGEGIIAKNIIRKKDVTQKV
jgi:hypothetical protein